VKTVEDRVNITAKKTGLTPEEVLRRFMRGELPLLGTAGAAYLGTREKD
jgi:hypothetical protein